MLFDFGAVEFIGGRGKLVRADLIKELSAKSKPLDELCSAFVEQAHKIQCITTFCETNKFRGTLVSNCSYLESVLPNRKIFLVYFLTVIFLFFALFLTGIRQIVSKRSATIGVGDHFQICKIKEKSEKAYQKIIHDCQNLGMTRSRCKYSTRIP